MFIVVFIATVVSVVHLRLDHGSVTGQYPDSQTLANVPVQFSSHKFLGRSNNPEVVLRGHHPDRQPGPEAGRRGPVPVGQSKGMPAHFSYGRFGEVLQRGSDPKLARGDQSQPGRIGPVLGVGAIVQPRVGSRNRSRSSSRSSSSSGGGINVGIAIGIILCSTTQTIRVVVIGNPLDIVVEVRLAGQAGPPVVGLVDRVGSLGGVDLFEPNPNRVGHLGGQESLVVRNGRGDAQDSCCRFAVVASRWQR
mmetsp:Transcript_29771/g.70097  ORF Transcript_29771/g.70097 Transcript_29771/m.70097 type:complete len:249 (-) Transcript_29771:388-1134(-)